MKLRLYPSHSFCVCRQHTPAKEGLVCLNRFTVSRRTNTEKDRRSLKYTVIPLSNLESPVKLTCMLLHYRRKQLNRSDTDSVRNYTHKVPNQPAVDSLLLWGQSEETVLTTAPSSWILWSIFLGNQASSHSPNICFIIDCIMWTWMTFILSALTLWKTGNSSRVSQDFWHHSYDFFITSFYQWL